MRAKESGKKEENKRERQFFTDLCHHLGCRDLLNFNVSRKTNRNKTTRLSSFERAMTN